VASPTVREADGADQNGGSARVIHARVDHSANPRRRQSQGCLLRLPGNVAHYAYSATHARTTQTSRHHHPGRQAGRHTDPATFAAAASQAAAGRDAGILSAHTADEIICVVSVPAATGPQAVAVALAVVADALSTGDPLPSPSR
jgi:hypothetical protein